MKDYKSYMDRVNVSDELHHKLLELESEKKERTPVKWKTYAAVACAALVIAVGFSAWLHTGHDIPANYVWGESGPASDDEPLPSAYPSQEAIDLAPEDPNGAEPGMKTIPGYEVKETRAGVDVVVYHVLPYIEYSDVSAAAQAAFDWDIPKGATRRDLTRDEIVTLLGGAEAMGTHLDWLSYGLHGWAAWYEDGSFWGAYLNGYKGAMDHFEFAVTAGQMPPTCIVFPDSVEQEIWGLTVTADKYDGKDGCSRRVSFMKDGYGYRFDLTATGEPEAAETLVSRAVTYIAVGDGLNFASMTGEGASDASPEPSQPVQWIDPSYSVPPQDGEMESPPSLPPQAAAPSVGPT